MSNSQLVGKAKELNAASILVENDLYVFFPLVDNGFDLVVSNKTGTKFIPVQVKYKEKRSGFSLNINDAEKFKTANAALIFCSKDQTREVTKFWFIPASEWYTKSEDRKRKDNMRVVYFKGNSDWVSQYEDVDGLKNTFSSLLK
jgi:hypothetical protein